MSGRCRHPERDVFPLKWRPVSEEAYRAGYVISSMKSGTMHWTFAGNDQPQALWCRRCRSWLPLGHSDETPERVAVEIRAAEMALKHDSASAALRWNYIYETHCDCWFDGDAECCRCGFDGDVETPCEVGYLARVIACHEDETP